jgi:sugar phosphate permease
MQKTSSGLDEAQARMPAGRGGGAASKVRYTVIAFALTLAMLAYIQRVAISQAAVPLSADLGLDKAEMGLIFGAFALSYALLEIPMGALGDKFGVRRVLAPLVLLWSAFTAITGAAWNFTSLWVIRFIFGAGEAGCFPNLTKMLSVWLPQRERVRAQSLMWACTRWAGAVTPPIALFVIMVVGWRNAFVVFGLLGVMWVVAFFLLYKDDPQTHPRVNEQELELLQGSRALAAEIPEGGWFKVVANVDVLLLVIQYAFFSFVWYFYVTWLPTYLVERWNLTLAQAAGYAVFPLLFGGFGALVSGMIPARIPRRTIALFGFVATALLLFSVTKATSVQAAILMMALASFCSDLTMPISWNTCVEVGRRYTATVAATMNMFSGLAGFVAPVLFGIMLKEVAGDWDPILMVMAGAACVSAVCWLFLNPDALAAKNAAMNARGAPADGQAASLGEP